MSVKKSETLAAFLNMIVESREAHAFAYTQVGTQDKLTQDLLHELELGKYETRRKTATTLANCRKERRYYKDIVEETELLCDWAEEFQTALRQLQEVLGKMRKVEKYHENRTYSPRVKKDGNNERDKI